MLFNSAPDIQKTDSLIFGQEDETWVALFLFLPVADTLKVQIARYFINLKKWTTKHFHLICLEKEKNNYNSDNWNRMWDFFFFHPCLSKWGTIRESNATSSAHWHSRLQSSSNCSQTTVPKNIKGRRRQQKSGLQMRVFSEAMRRYAAMRRFADRRMPSRGRVTYEVSAAMSRL